ncbi:hypothetical protein MIR68_012412 [Amoeboaphelidium protococcarum]|nr:hypothetical protein MIR68_012412 [Amoeboaphelidium protococcarum]
MVGLITQEYATTKSQNLQSALDPWMRFESGGDSFRITTFVDSEDNEQQLYLSYVDLVSNVCNQYEELKNVLLQPQWFRRLFAVMALNSQGVGTSALEQHQQDLTQLLQQQNNCVTEQQKHQIEDYFQQLEVIDPLIEEVSGEFTRVEGSGLYLMHSKLNHSCVPNAQVLFTENNSNLRVVALRDIAAGEEICISYIDDCCSEEDSDDQQDVNGDDDMATEMDHDYEDVDGEQEDSEDGEPATTRRDRLEMYYNFVCNCEKCIREFSQHE